MALEIKGVIFGGIGMKIAFQAGVVAEEGSLPREFITCPLEGLASNPPWEDLNKKLYDS